MAVVLSCVKTSFVFTTDENLPMIIDDADSVNTKKQISYAVNRMKMFASSAGVSSIEIMTETELDRFLARYFAGLRKEDSSYYIKSPCMGDSLYDDTSYKGHVVIPCLDWTGRVKHGLC